MNAHNHYIICLYKIFLLWETFNYVRTNPVIGADRVRLKRQAGYVYEHPTVTFQLPSQTNIGSTTTQSTTVGRTSAQQMYYAYPAPAVDSVKIGYSNTALTAQTSTSSSGAGGYNYGGNQNVAVGTTASVGSTVTTGSTGYNYGTQTSGAPGYSAPASGYNSAVPISTMAPKYLPPRTGGGNIVVNTQTVQSSTAATPSELYLPPVSVPQSSPAVSVIQSGGNVQPSVSVVTQTSTVPVAQPNSGYLAPNQTPQNVAPPTQQYLPPVVTTARPVIQTSVSTPASTYLPPAF